MNESSETIVKKKSFGIEPPLIPASRTLNEITVKALLLGMFLSMIMAAANAYIGLLVGLTVSASIPAAAVSMGVLRLFPRSNILENNLVQTSASAGESLVAGVIFTIPALVMMNAWSQYEYWPIVIISLIGGVMGVVFTIPLRRALIIEARLKFPEGVATAEVLKTGGIERDRTKPEASTDKAAKEGFSMLLSAAGVGAVYNMLCNGVGLIAGELSAMFPLLGGKFILKAGMATTPALVGVGFIVGLNVAVLVFLGGLIGTVIGVPLNWLINGDTIMTTVGIDPTTPFAQLSSADWSSIARESWSNCRRIGVGSMMIGGVWSIISLIKPVIQGVKASLSAFKSASSGGAAIPRTEMDTPFKYLLIIAVVLMVPIYFVFFNALEGYGERAMIAVIMTVMFTVLGCIFSSVAGYMAGLVGSSNNPISGVTLATVITSALILVSLMGNTGIAAKLGPIAVLYLAGMICSAAAIAGDNIQDLKCGHVIGATPWRQQIFQVMGVVSAAFVIPLILQVLDMGQGIGRPSPNPNIPASSALAAPQAGLMRDLATGIFGGSIAWGYIYLGFGLAVLLIILDEIQKKRGSDFRFPVLAVSVGIYLPMSLSVPIFLGGILAHFLKKKTEREAPKKASSRENAGLLIASGLITGEALMGVVVAVVAAFIMPLPIMTSVAPVIGNTLGVAALIYFLVYIHKKVLKN